MVTRLTCSAIHFHAELLNSLWPNDTLRHYGSCTNLSSCLIHWPTDFDGFWLIVSYCDWSHACLGIILNITTSYCCMTFWILLFGYTCSQCAGPVFYLSQTCLRTVLDSNNLLSFLAKTIWFSVAVLATRSQTAAKSAHSVTWSCLSTFWDNWTGVTKVLYVTRCKIWKQNIDACVTKNQKKILCSLILQ